MTSAMDACRAAGITYRMLDYWVSSGWLGLTSPRPGYGHPRKLTAAEVESIRLAARLYRAGLTAHTACAAAMAVVHGNVAVADHLAGISAPAGQSDGHRPGTVELAPGITLTVTS